MNRILALIAALTLTLTVNAADGVRLEWEYPLSLQDDASLVFKIYSHTDITEPLTNWPVLTNVAGTNLTIDVPLEPQKRFFFMTASNFWGESEPSNRVSTPAAAKMPTNPAIYRLKQK